MKRLLTIIIVCTIVILCADTARCDGNDVPINGTFNIDGAAADYLSFSPEPWDSPNPISTVWVVPFATEDLYAGSGPYNLAEAKFSNHSIALKDFDDPVYFGFRTGDLGIRIGNFSGSDVTFAESILTIEFLTGSFDVHLPEYTFVDDGLNPYTYFWVSQFGATYYANSSMSSGLPDMTAQQAMDEGDTYLAATPEPATIMLLGLGALALRKKK